jgi:hypothetical protein
MMISDEKAPAFSAKTLNLPTAPDNLTAQIVALSRERYAQEKSVVEELVRKNAGLAIDQTSEMKPELPAQPAKPRVQAQVQQLDKLAAEEAANKSVKLGSLLQQISTPELASEPVTPKKRRRGKRGGRKNKPAGGQSAIIRPSHPAGDNEHEQVIHLR